MTPRRIQKRRSKGWRKANIAPGAVWVGRPSKWGNPHRVEVPGDPASQRAAVEAYRRGLTPELIAAARAELRGRDLMCTCAPALACHADVLLKVANE